MKNIYLRFIIFVFFYLLYINILLYLSYIDEKEELYNVIMRYVGGITSIANTDCVNKENKSFICARVDSIFQNGSYIAKIIYKRNKIRFGSKNLIKDGYIKRSAPKNHTIYESYKFYMFKHIYVNQYGSIITSSNQYISIKGGCRCNKELNNMTNYRETTKYYNLVFQITQYLGSSIYHSIINCLTKIVPLIYTINQLIYSKIHIHKNRALINYLKLLNISKRRLTYGTIFSKYIIIMGRVECTSTIYTHSILELRDLLMRKINKKLSSSHNNEKSILFIKRLYTRKIKNFEDIFLSICKILTNFTCKIYNPSTEFNMMINLFSKADIIFGPHGAGFTNIIVSKDDVIIYEIIKENHPVLCFSALSHILGYKYYGIYSKCDSNEQFHLNATYISKYFIRHY